MSWERPTIKTLVSRISGDISARLLDGGTILTRSVLAVLAKVWAGACHGMYGFFAWLFPQVFVDTAEAEFMERWAAVWNITRLDASSAVGSVILSGTTGAVVTAGTLLINNATQQQYSLDADATIASGQAVAAITAVVAGAAGNCAAGTELSLVAPVTGVTSTCTVKADSNAAGLSGGADVETDDSLRARVLVRLRTPPRGGSAADYIAWAKSISGVTRAWCYPLMMGPGTVGLCFVTDNASTGPIPTQTMVDRVAAFVETVRPAAMEGVDVFGPTPLENTVRLKITPDTETLRAAVVQELADLWAREAEPSSTLYLSHIREAVSLTASELDHTLVLPTADIVADAGVLPILKTVEFVGSDGTVTPYPVGGAA
ncbi:baseplate J/gp47 family protein [uncultured Desulfovibrio sp.]|uniref:baseplate J/gp47 family protein n=1 Tax=uncultured Desulfovibrio sp. TaxID=167968 RepID=UPI0025CC5DA5|nr:baseplate J/gp47 family protein [uncultured Desulfovibrio sp.]